MKKLTFRQAVNYILNVWNSREYIVEQLRDIDELYDRGMITQLTYKKLIDYFNENN